MVKVDKEAKIRDVLDFINERIIITENEDDSIMISDVFYFLNQYRDYHNTINYLYINQAIKRIQEDHEEVVKRSFKGSMNIVGVYWKPTKLIC
jgi:formaldehyde-activating enzyme involved in methanogenesis